MELLPLERRQEAGPISRQGKGETLKGNEWAAGSSNSGTGGIEWEEWKEAQPRGPHYSRAPKGIGEARYPQATDSSVSPSLDAVGTADLSAVFGHGHDR